MVAEEELIAQKNYEQAEPHIGHPVEELYGTIEGAVNSLKVPEFKLTERTPRSKSAPDKPETTTVSKAWTVYWSGDRTYPKASAVSRNLF